jgi:Ca2+-binding EF-hand superfamily protein
VNDLNKDGEIDLNEFKALVLRVMNRRRTK